MSSSGPFLDIESALLKFALVMLCVAYAIGVAIDVMKAREARECAESGYPQYWHGHCVRTVDGTDEVVPLEELRDE